MPKVSGKVGTLLPAKQADGTFADLRTGPYGAPFVLPLNDPQMGAMEGSYFTATNPTWGTGIAMTSATRTTFSATEAALLIRNTSSTLAVIPHFIRLVCTAAGTAGTNSHWGLIQDTGNRYGSGGTLLTGAGVNTSVAGGPTAQVYFGNVTASAAVAARQLARFTTKTQAAPCLVVGDQVTFWFGGDSAASTGAINGSATTNIELTVPPAFLVGSNHCMLLHFWATSQSAAPSFEVSVGWWER